MEGAPKRSFGSAAPLPWGLRFSIRVESDIRAPQPVS